MKLTGYTYHEGHAKQSYEDSNDLWSSMLFTIWDITEEGKKITENSLEFIHHLNIQLYYSFVLLWPLEVRRKFSRKGNNYRD